MEVADRGGQPLIVPQRVWLGDDDRPLDPDCACYTCRSFSRAYLRHLHTSNEVLAPRLLTLHTVTFYQRLMERLRAAIPQGRTALEALAEEAESWHERYRDPGEPDAPDK